MFENPDPKSFDFLQIFCFKVLPCPEGTYCHNCPRTGSTRNQYYENELSCPFFHHDKDRRRPVLGDHNHSDFKYKASYKPSKENPSENTVSLNWFESLYHPMFYKIYECKRQHCSRSAYCPFYHDISEKVAFEDYFGKIMPKQRANYSKDKKNFTEQNSSELKPLNEIRPQVAVATPTVTSLDDVKTQPNRNLSDNSDEKLPAKARKHSPETPVSGKSTRKSSADSENASLQGSPRSNVLSLSVSPQSEKQRFEDYDIKDEEIRSLTEIHAQFFNKRLVEESEKLSENHEQNQNQNNSEYNIYDTNFWFNIKKILPKDFIQAF